MKKLHFTLILITCLLALHPNAARANAIAVSGVTVNLASGTVTFNIAWENSFWDGLNWDAAWVFVKFRDCNNPSQEFLHGLISTTLAQHSLGSFSATDASGMANVIDPAPNNTGIMLRRGTPGVGDINATVTLRVNNLPASGDWDVRIYAIEMVFIPRGTFFAGDGNGTLSSYNSFNQGTQYAVPIYSEDTITLNVSGYNELIPAGMPKGYDAFYMMKYEISQGQYADFLNGCASGQSVSRFPNTFGQYRNQLSNTGTYPKVYYSTRPDRAMNYLNWDDVTAYLDWAALRPMSELQYEKACRGGAAVVLYECAWGNTTLTAATQISGMEDGMEIILAPVDANCYAFNVNLTGGDGGVGPVRCGIFATAATTTRLQTGASYWGVMELSGNVVEPCIHVLANASANGVNWGDGMLAMTGDHNVASWPVADYYLIIFRGGGYNATGCNGASGMSSASVSSRDIGVWHGLRLPYRGGRGIR